MVGRKNVKYGTAMFQCRYKQKTDPGHACMLKEFVNKAARAFYLRGASKGNIYNLYHP